MLKDLLLFITLLTSLFFIGCNEDDYIEVAPLIINLRDLNTQYDDFNSAGPSSFSYSDNFIYSTNVGSAGNNFDIWKGRISISTSEQFPMDETNYNIDNKKEAPFYHTKCNSEYNEFGPYIWLKDQNKYHSFLDEDNLGTALYIFASDRPTDSTTNILNLFYLNHNDSVKQLPINSKSNDAYACYVESAKTLLFCSDRDGQYDIYQSTLKQSQALTNYISDTTFETPTKNSVLSSEYDDKCPYFLDNILLFVSNRYGNHDNFDIYYSKFYNGSWSTPVRCPEVMEDEDVEIITDDTDKMLLNSTYNEYRPILVKGWGFNSDEPYLILFSSDRPGGKGGYDLHLAILPDNIFD